MRTREEILYKAIEELDNALLTRQKVKVAYKNRLFDHYSDTTGQRDHFLGHYHHSKSIMKTQEDIDKGRYSGTFTVYRLLSFINRTDRGKDLAVLGVIHLNNCENISIDYSVKNIVIKADFITLTILGEDISLIHENNFEGFDVLNKNSLVYFVDKDMKKEHEKIIEYLPYGERLDLADKLKEL